MTARLATALLCFAALGLASGTAGCAEARKPKLVIQPTYSFAQSGVGLETTPPSAERATLSARVATLPPTPPAPGFE